MLFDQADGIFLSNRGEVRCAPVTPGVHALSNASLDTPWPKVQRITEGLGDLVMPGDDLRPEMLFAILADTTPAAAAELPATGVPHDWEQRLSSIHIPGPGYGTRCATVVLFECSGCVTMVERTFGETSDDWSETGVSWQLA